MWREGQRHLGVWVAQPGHACGRIEQHDRWLGFDRGDVAQWFRDAGLEEVRVEDTQEICSPTSNCGTRAAITIFLASGLTQNQRG